MKNYLTLLLSTIMVCTVSVYTFAQTQVSYTVEHSTDYPSTVNGCSRVQFEVVYNTGGANASATTPWHTMNQGGGLSLMVTIPTGATIVSKKVNFSFSLSSNTYSYTITGSSNASDFLYATCNCPPTPSKVIVVQEVITKSGNKVVYYLDSPLGGC